MPDPVDTKISEFAVVTSLQSGDIFPIVRAGENKGITGANALATALLKANNLSDLASPSTARTNLGLGLMAQQGATINFDLTVNGIVTADAFVGNGAGLTGIGSGTGGVINTGSTTIGADSDSDSVGVIDLQTRATTRMRVLNAGDIYILKKVGINQPAPIASLDIKPTYADGVTTQERLLNITTPNGKNFGVIAVQVLEGADPNDDIVMWGWNPNATLVAQTIEPALHFSMERAFGSGDAANFEVHLEVFPKDGAGSNRRPWTWTINRKTGDSLVQTNARANFVTAAGALQLGDAEFLYDDAPLRFRSDSVTFETLDNGGTPAKQLRIATHHADSEQSALVFGNANGLQVHGAGGIFQIRDLNAGELADYSGRRIFLNSAAGDGVYVGVTKVLGAQGAAVADATDNASAILRLNELLARMRAHGAIAT